MSSETGCSVACSKDHHTGADRPGKYIFLNILHLIVTLKLIPTSMYPINLLVSSIARLLLIHARLPDTFWYYALHYAAHIFNVLLTQRIKETMDFPSTSYGLFFSYKSQKVYVI
jgi:hypothetical protein